jgi:NAD(P)-dependent dehydrogenase (short-subunit alcohol dehydrogenase family)
MPTESLKIAVVTGAARRVGAAIARDLAQHGWSVAIHSRTSSPDAAALVRAINDSGGKATVIEADLTSATDVAALVPACIKVLGAPTCLVNNASLFEYDAIETLDGASWERHHAINVRAPVFLAQALANHLPAGLHGNVINIIDQRVWKPTPHFLSYSASKAELWWMTRTLAQALAPRIRVNAIGPGPTLQSVHQSDADFQSQTAATLLQRGTNPAEIARAIQFILDAPAMTGQMIALDGGQHLAWQTPDIGDGKG